MLFDLSFQDRFGIILSFSIYQDHVYYFHILNFWPSHVNTKTSKPMLQIQILIDFAKNGTDGHEMNLTTGKPECSAKNQNFGIFEMACMPINQGRGAMTFKARFKGAKHVHAPPPQKDLKMAQNRQIPRYKKKTKQLVLKKSLVCLYYSFSLRMRYPTTFQKLWHLFEIRRLPKSSLSGSAIDDLPTFNRNLYNN